MRRCNEQIMGSEKQLEHLGVPRAILFALAIALLGLVITLEAAAADAEAKHPDGKDSP
jgi:hypothetical protein